MNFQELTEAVFLHSPILKKVLSEKGHLPLRDYFEENTNSSSTINPERQNELVSVIKKMITEVIDPDIAEAAITQLRNQYYVSTADHHGPITHPFFVNSHLAQSIANTQSHLNNIFVFSCGGISLNNSSFPRGILLILFSNSDFVYAGNANTG